MRWSRWLIAGGGILLIIALVGFVFDLFPDLKPTPKAICQAQGGDLSDVLATERITRGAYLLRQGDSTEGIPKKRLAEPGELIRFNVSTKGYLHKQLVIATRVFDAGQTPVTEPGLANPRARQLEPVKCEDEGHYEVWSAIPSRRGKYVVQLRLLDPRGGELDAVETQSVDV